MVKTDKNLKAFLITEEEAYQTKDLATYTQYLKDQNKTLDIATVKTKALAFAKNMAINAGIAFASFLVSKGIQALVDWANRAEIAREKSTELTKAWSEENSSIDSSISKYKQLKESLDSGTLSTQEIANAKNELAEIQDTLTSKYGQEALGIDLVNGKYDEQIKKLDELSRKKAEDYTAENYANIQEDIKYVNNSVKVDEELGSGAVFNPDTYNKYLKKYLDEYDALTTRVTDRNGIVGSSGLNIVGEGTREEIYNQLTSLFNDLSRDFGEDNPDVNKLKTALSGIISDSFDTEKMEQAKSNIKRYAEAQILSQNNTRQLYEDAINAVDNYNKALASGQGVEEAKANLDEVKQKVADNTSGISGAGQVFEDVWGGISEGAKTISENVNKMTVSLDNLTKASEGISTLQKAFKELSDDGYITTDTLLKIKEATGLADDEWSAYEQRLLNAEAGSDEFNKALSDLTYEVLEAKLQTGELTDAEKTYVENLLKGNGVVNATEIASAAIEKLVAWEDIFNNSQLDVSDKIKKLDEMAKAIGKPIAEMVVLNSLLSGSMGGSFNDDGSYTYKVKSSKPQDYADKEVTLSPSDIQNMIRDAYDAIWEETKPIAEYSPDTSSKNEPLDNALKQAERLYKVHQNELEYIKDLKTASANYAKNKEEQLEIEDKITEARKDYAQNQISDIEHQIEMLQTLKGEEVNVVKFYEDIQGIAHNEAERLRKLGYDDNSSEIQELQKQWWDAKQAIDEYRKSLLDTRISNYEHDIFLIEKNEADSQKILEIYRKMQEEIHAEAEYYRSLGVKENDERIQELQKQWWEYQDNINEVREKILSDIEEMVTEANDLLDGFQDVYTTLTDAAKEYNSTGYLSVDSLQSILELSPKYLGFLYDENGQLVLNEDALQKVIAAQTEEMAVQNALAYAKQILNAVEQNDIETLTTLTQITTEGSNATWDMAYATLALAKAVGTANGMDSGYFDSAVSYIDKMQSLSKIAVNSISSYYKTLNEGYISQKDALDQILDITQDLIKWEQEQIIESLEKQKEDYQDIINKKKEMFQLTKEESDHEKSVAEKLQEIAKLQSRIEQLSLDDSREAQAQKKGLEEELNELQKDLADDQADYAVDVQIDALDKELEAFEDAKDDEIKAQKEMLDSAEELYQAAISRIENDWDGLYQDLLAWNAEYGSTLQSDLVNAWDAASAAVQRYGSFVQAYSNVDNYTDIGDSSGDSFDSNNTTDKDSVARNIVSQMKTNSNLWKQTSDENKRRELEDENFYLGQTLGAYLGKDVHRDEASGVWWIDGKKLFDVYHTGGIVGNNPTLKQNEVMTVLEEGEMVLTKEHQNQLAHLMSFAEILDMRENKSTDMTAFTTTFTHPIGGIDASRMPQYNNVSNRETINFSPEITVNINHSGAMSDSDLKRYGSTVADAALDKLKESFSRRGVSTIGNAMLK